MLLKGDKFVSYKGPRGPASIPEVFEVSVYRNYRRNNLWGDAVITGIAAASTGGATLTFASLSGVTVVACGGTLTLPPVVGNSIVFPSGSYWDLRLSNGAYIPDINSGYNVTSFGESGVPSGFTKDILSGGTMYMTEVGYNRVSGDMVPATEANHMIDVLGNPIIFTGVFNRLNFADGIIDYSDTPYPIFSKTSSVWASTTWDYDDGNQYHWLPSERTMTYLTSRLAPEYKNTIMIKEINVGGNLIGISREEVFSPAISDKNYNILNLIYNGVPLP